MDDKKDWTAKPMRAARSISDLTKGSALFSAYEKSEFESFSGSEEWFGSTFIQLVSWKSKGPCEITTHRSANHHLTIYIPVEGRFSLHGSGKEFVVNVGEILMVNTAGTIFRRWSGDCKLLNIGVKASSAERVLLAEFGVDGDTPLSFESFSLIKGDASKLLRLFVESMWLSYSKEMSKNPKCLQVETYSEKLLLIHLLRILPHNYSHAVADAHLSAKPYYIRRVERYVSVNFSEKVTLDDLVECSGVSERTLQVGFKASHGASPMNYLKAFRLSRAREKLLVARQNNLSLREIGDSVGYVSLSHFSRDYKKKFGVAPRDTRDKSLG